jgi:hypothetical protein
MSDSSTKYEFKTAPVGTETKPPAAPPPATKANVAKSPPAKLPPRYMVAKGKTIQCSGGRKRSGYSVTPRDVGGQKHFDQLLASGAIVEK